MNRSLIIVAHGSSVKPSTAQTVVEATKRLAERPAIRARFTRVEARFLKQDPLLEDTDWGDESVVVPFFMADGFFVQSVIPRYLPPSTLVTAPVGTADLSGPAIRIVESVAADAHLVLVGHGTEKNPESAATVERLAERLRTVLRSVTTGFVDQEPRLESVWDRVPTDEHPVVVLPYFAFPGPHTEQDIPDGLGLAPDLGPQMHDGRSVFYAPPIGMAPEIVDVLETLALAG